MGPGPWTLYNDAKLNFFKKLMDLGGDTFKVALVTSSSNGLVATLTPGTYGTLTGELTTANGYTAGGATAGSPTLTGGGATATITWNTNDVSWTASGAGFTARGAVMYDSTAGDLIAFFLLDSTPADVTIAAGNTLTISIASPKVFTAT